MASDDLSEWVELLASEKVEFVIVGGHAVAWHGHPRFTGDIDFLMRATPENARRVARVLERFGFGSLGVTEQDLLTEGQVIQLGRPPNRIDVLTSITGVATDEVFRNRVPGRLSRHDVHYISLPDLLANKRATGRAKDLADVEALTH
ncbi:MAG: hypothetical protein IV100_08790 [Myxococcales bacterium]|nr:hypothetical protein [Myxococcales bacterium]